MYYVSMTDKFMSGWGKAKGTINKYVVECATEAQAVHICRVAEQKREMKYVSLCIHKPRYPSHYVVTERTFDDLSGGWKEGWKDD